MERVNEELIKAVYRKRVDAAEYAHRLESDPKKLREVMKKEREEGFIILQQVGAELFPEISPERREEVARELLDEADREVSRLLLANFSPTIEYASCDYKKRLWRQRTRDKIALILWPSLLYIMCVSLLGYTRVLTGDALAGLAVLGVADVFILALSIMGIIVTDEACARWSLLLRVARVPTLKGKLVPIDVKDYRRWMDAYIREGGIPTTIFTGQIDRIYSWDNFETPYIHEWWMATGDLGEEEFSSLILEGKTEIHILMPAGVTYTGTRFGGITLHYSDGTCEGNKSAPFFRGMYEPDASNFDREIVLAVA